MKNQGSFLQLALGAILLLSGCKEYPKVEPMVTEEADYFPLEVGSQHKYRVKETRYDNNGISTDSYYWLREDITEKFTDLQGQPSYRAQLYRLDDTTDQNGWQADSVIVYTLTSAHLERLQSNQRIIDLVFPAKKGKSWNPNVLNASNSLGWEYVYQEIDATAEVSLESYPNSLFIYQDNSTHLIDSITTTAIYSKGVGLVKYNKLRIQFENVPGILPSGDITGGYCIRQTLIQ